MNDSKNHPPSQSARAQQGVLALAILMSLASVVPTALAQTSDGSTSDSGSSDTASSEPAPSTDAAATDASATPADAATTSQDGATASASTLAAPAEDSEEQELEEAAQTQAPTDGTTTAPDGQTLNADEVAEERQAEREPLAWRNSYFNYSINASFCSFARNCQLSYNPVVYSFFSLAPRWYLEPATFFTFSQSAYVEHTDDDGATYAHEFQLFDTRIGLNHREAAGNFLFLPGVNLWLPASKGSQAQQRYFRLGASFSTTWDPGVGGFNLSASLSYLHWFAGSNVALSRSAAYDASDVPGNNQAGSTTGESDRITAGITANWAPLEGFTITLQIFYIWVNGWGLGSYSVPVDGASTSDILLTDTSNHWRPFDSYSIYFQYDFVPWLQGWIGFSNSTQLASVFSDDGSVRSPVNLYDMQVALGTTITLDSVYEELATTGDDEDDGLTPEQRQRRRQGLASRSSSGGSM